MPTYLPGLTGLRGVGAVWVFIFHATDSMPIPVVKVGYLGVDVFFLLSGFVLSHACRNGIAWNTYPAFLRARAARIFPLHLATLAALALIVLLWPDFTDAYPTPAERFGLSAFIASMLLIQNWAYWLPTSWNAPAWSLSAEWFGYLVLPSVLMVSRRLVVAWAALAVCYAVLLALVVVLTLKGIPSLGVTGTPGMVRMMCEIASGCFLYRAFVGGVRLPLLAKVATLALFTAGVLYPGWDYLVLFAIPGVILAAADRETVTCRVLSTRVFQMLGEVSFSIYLTHWIVLQMSNRVLPLWAAPGWAFLPYLTFLAAVVLGISAVTYRWIELPSRRWGRAHPRPAAYQGSIAS